LPYSASQHDAMMNRTVSACHITTLVKTASSSTQDCLKHYDDAYKFVLAESERWTKPPDVSRDIAASNKSLRRGQDSIDDGIPANVKVWAKARSSVNPKNRLVSG
jgi:hypothetical protein